MLKERNVKQKEKLKGRNVAPSAFDIFFTLFGSQKEKERKRSNLFSLTEEEKKDCIPAEIFFKNQ
jgi:hypothetical protein